MLRGRLRTNRTLGLSSSTSYPGRLSHRLRPRCCSTRCGTTARAIVTGLRKLTAATRNHASGAISQKSVESALPKPALRGLVLVLLTGMCTQPSVSMVVFTRAFGILRVRNVADDLHDPAATGGLLHFAGGL